MKYFVKSLDEVEEAFRSLYKQVDGGYQLQVEGVVPKDKVDEFRNNNIELKKQIENLSAKHQQELSKFSDLDPEKYAEMVQKLQDIEDQDLIDKGDFDTLLAQRTERMQADHTGQVNKLTSELETSQQSVADLTSRLSEVLIDSEVQSAIAELAVPVKGAMGDILSRSRRAWKLEDGNPVPIHSDGTVRYGKDGKSPMTFVEWGTQLIEEAPFLFESSSGGGAGGGQQNSGGGGGGSTIARGDAAAFGSNLEDIAAGKVKVQ